MLGKIILIPLLITAGLILMFQNCAKYPYRKHLYDDATTLDTKQFYLVEENYTCQTILGDSIETFKNSLYFFGGNVCFTGNGCNDSVVCGAWPEDLEVSMDLQTVTYQGEVFHFMKTPPFDK